MLPSNLNELDQKFKENILKFSDNQLKDILKQETKNPTELEIKRIKLLLSNQVISL